MKRFSGVGLVVVLLVALVALPAMAKIDKAPVGKGSDEIGGALSVTSTGSAGYYNGTKVAGSETTTSNTLLMLNYGYYLTNAISLGITTMANVSTTTPETGPSSTMGMMMYGFRADYNFQLKNSPAILPFVAVNLMAASLNEGQDSFAGAGYGMAGGLRYFVSRQASVNAELDFNAFSLSGTNASGDVYTIKESQVGMLLGMSFFFGGPK